MIPLKRLRITVNIPNGVHSHEDNFARTVDLAARLAKVHPLLSELSWTGRLSGWKKRLTLPQIKNVTLDQWIENFDKNFDWDMPVLGAAVNFWNRRSAKHEKFMMVGHYNRSDNEEPNNFFVTTQPIVPQLIKPDIMDAMMVAFIDAFDATRADYICSDQSSGDYLKYIYQLWLKDGTPFPEAGKDYSMSADHPQPEISEPWHGGTRHIWPQHEPRAFLGLDN